MSDPMLRPLHLVESWPPVQTGYTMRSVELVAAQCRSLQRGKTAGSPSLNPRVVVSSRQSVHGRGLAERRVGEVDLRDRLQVVAPSSLEARMRRLRPFAVDGRALQHHVQQAVHELGADLVHTHWSSSIGWAGVRAAHRCGLPVVAEVRFDLAGAVTAQTARLRPAAARSVVEAALRRHFERHLGHADAVVAAGPSLAALLEDSVRGLPGPVAVAANGCDPVRFTPGAPEADLRREHGLVDRVVVGTTATMLRYEGLEELLRAAATLRRRHPDLVVLFVGDGPERVRLAQLADRLGVSCVFTGRVPSDRVGAYYRLFDVMAVPRRDVAVTRYAGPLKLLEAMATGLPCLATAVGDIPGLLGEGRGRLVEAGALGAFTEALDALLDDPAERAALGQAARRYSVEAASWEAAAQVHRDVYAGLTQRRQVSV